MMPLCQWALAQMATPSSIKKGIKDEVMSSSFTIKKNVYNDIVRGSMKLSLTLKLKELQSQYQHV